MKISIFLTALMLCFANINSSIAKNYLRKISISKSLDKEKKYYLLGDIDYRNDKDRLFQRHYDIGIGFKLNQEWFAALKHRNIYRKSQGEWDLYEKRSIAQIANTKKFEKITLKTRFRQEYRAYEHDQSARSRLRFQVIANDYFWKLKPVTNIEAYYDVKESRHSKTRFEAGFFLPEFHKITPSIYYRKDSFLDDEKKWYHDDSLILRVDIKF